MPLFVILAQAVMHNLIAAFCSVGQSHLLCRRTLHTVRLHHIRNHTKMILYNTFCCSPWRNKPQKYCNIKHWKSNVLKAKEKLCLWVEVIFEVHLLPSLIIEWFWTVGVHWVSLCLNTWCTSWLSVVKHQPTGDVIPLCVWNYADIYNYHICTPNCLSLVLTDMSLFSPD